MNLIPSSLQVAGLSCQTAPADKTHTLADHAERKGNFGQDQQDLQDGLHWLARRRQSSRRRQQFSMKRGPESSRNPHAQPKTERVIQLRQIIPLQMTKEFARQIAGN